MTSLDAWQFQFGDADDNGVATVSSVQWITQNQANAGDGAIDDLIQDADFVGDIFD